MAEFGWRRLALSVGWMLAASAGSGLEAWAATLASLDDARIAEGGEALVVPYSGPAPQVTLHQLSPTRYFYEFHAARYVSPYTLKGHGNAFFERFAMANRPGGTVVRLSLVLRRPAQPQLRVDEASRRLVVAFDGATPQAEALPTPEPVTRPSPQTRISGIYFDNARHMLVVGYQGIPPTPEVTRTGATGMQLSFNDAMLQRVGLLVQPFANHPVLRRWEAQDVPESNAARLRVETVAPADITFLYDTARSQLLAIPRPLETPANSPLDVSARTTPARLAAPVFDPRTGELSLPYAGPRPGVALTRLSLTDSKLEISPAILLATQPHFERVDLHPALTFWSLAPGQAPDRLRLNLHLPWGGDVAVTDDPAGHRLVVTVTPPKRAASRH